MKSKSKDKSGQSKLPEYKQEMPQTEEGWKNKLTPAQYRVLREKGTEMPFTGNLLKNKETGMYVCAGCGADLFSSDTKFESGTGWPSFYDVAVKGNVRLEEDKGMLMKRVEVKCAKCGGHLGHVFDDGPKPTGLRYCINSAALGFKKMPEKKVKIKK